MMYRMLHSENGHWGGVYMINWLGCVPKSQNKICVRKLKRTTLLNDNHSLSLYFSKEFSAMLPYV